MKHRALHSQPGHDVKEHRRLPCQSYVAAPRRPSNRLLVAPSVLRVDDLPKQSTVLPETVLLPTEDINDQHTQQQGFVAPPVHLWKHDQVLMSGENPRAVNMGRQRFYIWTPHASMSAIRRCEVTAAPLNVAVLLSGGVDSSLALQLLVAAGHKCKAFYLQIWFQEDFRNFWDQCPWEEDLKYAQQVCDSLGVELEVVPMTEAYWKQVVSSSVEEIRGGRTPNPDMLCNSRVKFGAFLDYLDQLERSGQQDVEPHKTRFDRVASGHYARVVRYGETAQLMLTPDAIKDQTYFLAHLTQKQLAKVMFPLGTLSKSQVRALAATAGLATQSRKDSQGICFLGKVKFPEFVKEHLGEWHGLIIEDEVSEETASNQPTANHQNINDSSLPISPFDTQGQSTKNERRTKDSSNHVSESSSSQQSPVKQAETGLRRRRNSPDNSSIGNKGGAAPTLGVIGGRRVLGTHAGFWFYTVGQRGGIKLPGGPWYVVRKDCDLNIVYVSRRYNEKGKQRNAFTASSFSWLSDKRPDISVHAPQPLLCKVRHGPHAYQCQLRPLPSVAETVESSRHVENQPAHTAELKTEVEPDTATMWQGCLVNSGHESVANPRSSYYPFDNGALVVIDGSDQGLAAGQYAVFYQGGVCLGTAKIEACVDVEVPYDSPNAMGVAGTLTAHGLQFCCT